jgi:hypothetical protein
MTDEAADPATLLNELQQSLASEDEDMHGDAQDRFADFVTASGNNDSVVVPVMALIDHLEKIRRPWAIDAAVAVALRAPEGTPLNDAAQHKWEELIERIAAEDIFLALKWAALPGLYSFPETLLQTTGVVKWSDLIDRAAEIDYGRALAYAREMSGAEPWSAIAVTAQLSVQLLESRPPQQAGGTPPAPPFN